MKCSVWQVIADLITVLKLNENILHSGMKDWVIEILSKVPTFNFNH